MNGVFRLLLSVSLLMCPLKCSGALAGEGSPQVKNTGCSCCSRQLPAEDSVPSDDSSPVQHNCGCTSCLCQGAVVEGQSVTLDLDVAGEFFLDVDLLAVTSRQISSLAIFDWSSEPLAALPAGQHVRILHQSFLL